MITQCGESVTKGCGFRQMTGRSLVLAMASARKRAVRRVAIGPPEREPGREGGPQPLVDVLQFRECGRALWALVDVAFEGFAAAYAAASHRGGEQSGEGAAVFVVHVGQVHLQICLAQALPCSLSQRGDSGGGYAEKKAHHVGRLAFDRRVPQHKLPAFGQGLERLEHQ